jgi:hypothetical protein
MGLRRSLSLAELMGPDGLHRIVSAHLKKGWLSVERVNYLLVLGVHPSICENGLPRMAHTGRTSRGWCP